MPEVVSSETQPTDVGSRWYAVYTAANQEKTVSERLRQKGVEQYLPLYRTVRRRTDRRVVLHLPLFPGYLFVHINIAEKKRVLELPKVVRLVGNGALPSTVPDEQIEKLQRGLAAEGKVCPCPNLSMGSRVRVVKGPFSGIEGTLRRRKGDLRVVVWIELIACSFSIEVGEEDIERVR
jgi:transcription antitermination factor NusG